MGESCQFYKEEKAQERQQDEEGGVDQHETGWGRRDLNPAVGSSHAAPDQQRRMLRRSDVVAQAARNAAASAKGAFM